MTRHVTEFDKKRIAAVLPLRERANTSQVMRQIDGATQRFWKEALAEFHWEGGEFVESKGRVWLRITKRPYLSKGRPRKEAVRRYVAALVSIYETATGDRITRIYDAYANRTKRHPFLVACLKAAGIPTYPTALVREVIEKS